MELQMKDVRKSFGEKEVLKGISFRAVSGKAFGLLGRNGAGKTTSIRILMDVFPADSGEIMFSNAPVDYKKVQFGYLPEERGLYPKKDYRSARLFRKAQGHAPAQRRAVGGLLAKAPGYGAASE